MLPTIQVRCSKPLYTLDVTHLRYHPDSKIVKLLKHGMTHRHGVLPLIFDLNMTPVVPSIGSLVNFFWYYINRLMSPHVFVPFPLASLSEHSQHIKHQLIVFSGNKCTQTISQFQPSRDWFWNVGAFDDCVCTRSVNDCPFS